MVIFENPNDPIQPMSGVYGWYAEKKGGNRITIYIGQAGKRYSLLPKGTLFRGVTELQRNTFTSNSPDYNCLDTDFIVGTAIKYFQKEGYDCIWRHLSNEPHDEFKYVEKEKPILQNSKNSRISNEFRLRRDEKHYWKGRNNKAGVQEAEKLLFRIIKALLTIIISV